MGRTTQIEDETGKAEGADPAALTSQSTVDSDLAEVRERLSLVGQAMVPLAQYLQIEDHLVVVEGVEITVEQVATAAIEALKESKAQIAELQAKVELLTPAAVPPKKTKALNVPETVAGDDFAEASMVVFGDDHGQMIGELPALAFQCDQFVTDGDGRTLSEAIEFPVHIPARAVSAVFLTDGKFKPVAVAELIQPLAVGGGRAARINGGSLLFRAPATGTKGGGKTA